MKRTYKQVPLPAGQKGYVIHEIFEDRPEGERVGDCVLHMLAATPAETMSDTVGALQRAYEQGREDREAEIQAEAQEIVKDFIGLPAEPYSFSGKPPEQAGAREIVQDARQEMVARDGEGHRIHLITSHGYVRAALEGMSLDELKDLHDRQPLPHRHTRASAPLV